MRIGITLPQFSGDAVAMLAAAKRAEDEGLDAVFAYDHYPREGRPEALHGMTMLGAIAAATSRIRLGTLVARIGVVPDGVLLSQMRTASKLAGPGRFVAGVGVGDKQSDPEDEALGITRPPVDERFERLEFVAHQLHADGIEVWVAGRSRRAATLSAALGIARNLWDPTEQQLADAVREAEGRPITWGQQVDVTNDDGVAALAAKFAALHETGIDTAVAAPTKAGAPDAAARVMSARDQAGLP